MAIVLPGSFIYLAHMHTGSTAVARSLKKIDGAFAAYHKRKGIGHHATLEEVKQVCGDKLTGGEKTFTIVRNPYDVLVAMFVSNQGHYQFRSMEARLRREPTLKEFLEMWLELNRRPYLEDGRLFFHEAKVYLRYERLQVELDTLIRRLPDTPGSLPVELEDDTSERDHWTSYYDDATYTYVNEHFKDDIVKFGYPFIWSNDRLA
jgi:hypothetical protein